MPVFPIYMEKTGIFYWKKSKNWAFYRKTANNCI